MPNKSEAVLEELRKRWRKRSKKEREAEMQSAAHAIYGFLKQGDYLCAKAYLTTYKNLGEDWLRVWEKVMELVAYLDVAPNPDKPMPIMPETVIDIAPDGERERAIRWVRAFYWEAAKAVFKGKKT